MKSYLHIITLIILNFTAGCEARVHEIYKSIGDKAHLTFKEHRNVTAVKWRKDNYLIATVENKKPDTRNPGKYHIHASDNSLFIHNLTVNDSGDYEAQTGQWETQVIQYKLIVQEAVSIPVIEAKPKHRSNSSFVCDILVKCSADGDSVMYDCDHQLCTWINATSTRVNLTVNYTDNEVLECTASNRVSTKQTSIRTINTCLEKQSASATSYNGTLILISICCTALIVLFIICFITIYSNANKKKQNKEPFQEDKSVNTVYNVVCKKPRTETPADSSAAQNAATSVYDVPSICARAAQCESVQKEDTHTVYWKLGQTHEP